MPTLKLPATAMSSLPQCTFCSPTTLNPAHRQPSIRISTRRPRTHRSPAPSTPAASLSFPFPLPDPFAFPTVAFINTAASSDFRPELVGSCLWTVGLYFGFSQRERWGTAVQKALADKLANVMPREGAELVSAALHTVPFLVAGFSVDTLLRYGAGSNAVWAVSTGISVAMYGGIYELGRQSNRRKGVGDSDRDKFNTFGEFATRKLVGKGRCHLFDIRAAIRQDPKGRQLGVISDETLRRFVRNRFPQARRSPNGYYRGLSIKDNAPAKDDVTSSSSATRSQ